MVKKSVKQFYGSAVRYEWRRLVRDPFHRLEFDTTLRFLDKYLPRKGLVLDAGGGPGRYTVELAKRGYDVILLDITPESLEFAKRQIKKAKLQERVRGVIEGSIVDLSMFEKNSFDAVVCLGGPLSHIPTEKGRRRAVLELVRVAKRGAPVFASVMGRLGVLMDSVKYWPEEIAKSTNFNRIIERGDDYLWRGKYYCHFFLPEELRKLFKRKNLKILEMVGLEGLGSPSRREVNKLARTDKKAWKNWLKAHLGFCTHPALVGVSAHMLIVCKKL